MIVCDKCVYYTSPDCSVNGVGHECLFTKGRTDYETALEELDQIFPGAKVLETMTED